MSGLHGRGGPGPPDGAAASDGRRWRALGGGRGGRLRWPWAADGGPRAVSAWAGFAGLGRPATARAASPVGRACGPYPGMRVCPPDRIGYSSLRIPVWCRAGAAGRLRGRGSVGRASPCQGEGRGFESRRPLGGAGSRLACRRSARLFGTGPTPRVGRPVAEWPSGLGKGLQSPVRGFDSRFRLGGG
jgi:hypothetical protein